MDAKVLYTKGKLGVDLLGTIKALSKCLE